MLKYTLANGAEVRANKLSTAFRFKAEGYRDLSKCSDGQSTKLVPIPTQGCFKAIEGIQVSQKIT
jgi:hypothetical protein